MNAPYFDPDRDNAIGGALLNTDHIGGTAHRAPFFVRELEAVGWTVAPLRAAEGAAAPAYREALPESISSVLGSPELPPLPWTSPALLQPWPNSAADADEIRDAHGRAITSRNWRETAHALMLVVLAVNYVHRQSLVVPASPAVRDPEPLAGRCPMCLLREAHSVADHDGPLDPDLLARAMAFGDDPDQYRFTARDIAAEYRRLSGEPVDPAEGSEAALQLDQPWPTTEAVRTLLNRMEHVLDVHDCDHVGYETVQAAMDSARRFLALAAAVREPVDPEPTEPAE